jgi:toxin ParE1/3/4
VKNKPVIPRQAALRDVDEAVLHYIDEAGEKAAQGFIDALEKAFRHIGRHPATGSPRYAHELSLEGLRFWALNRYPYLVFYVEQSQYVEVWRVLHERRDIPKWLQEPDA